MINEGDQDLQVLETSICKSYFKSEEPDDETIQDNPDSNNVVDDLQDVD